MKENDNLNQDRQEILKSRAEYEDAVYQVTERLLPDLLTATEKYDNSLYELIFDGDKSFLETSSQTNFPFEISNFDGVKDSEFWNSLNIFYISVTPDEISLTFDEMTLAFIIITWNKDFSKLTLSVVPEEDCDDGIIKTKQKIKNVKVEDLKKEIKKIHSQFEVYNYEEYMR